jgi:iron complex outermembrane recepter protein
MRDGLIVSNAGRPFSRRWAAGVLASASLCVGAAAQAHADAPEELVVVTAQKRAEAARDVPISLTVISAAQAREAGVNSTLDLVRLTPGLAIGQNSGEGDFPFVALRGVTMRDFADTNESPSAVYLDGFYKANLMGLDSQAFDLERIEILRGPQGALYGRNATGGLIHFITAKPTRAVSGAASATVGDVNRLRVEVAIGGPLSRALSGRVSALYHRFDGHIRNDFPGRRDGNGLDARAVRAQLRFAPNADVEATFLAQYSRNDADGNLFTHVAARPDPVTGLSTRTPGGVDAFGFGDSAPRASNSNRAIYLTTEQVTGVANVAWRFGDVTLTAISGYESGFKDALFDSDATPGPRGTEVHPDAMQASQELRVSGARGALTWTAGVYLFRYQVDGWQRRQTSAAGPRPIIFYALNSDSVAGFAHLDWVVSPRLTATGGLRLTREWKTYRLKNTDTGPVFTPETVGAAARRDDGATDFTARVSWRPRAGGLLYAGVARAHKAGTFNVGYTPIPLAAIPVRPEQLTSYEIGARHAFAGGRLRLDGAVFSYDYKDSQAFQFDGQALASTTFNRDAEILGGEISVTARPFDGLELSGSLTHLNATLRGVQLPAGPVRDTQMPLAPAWSANLAATLRWPAPGDGEFALRGDVSYRTAQFFDAFNSPSQREPAYAIANVSALWRGAQGWTLGAFAENVTDTEYRTGAFDLAFLGFATEVWGRPRRLGVRVAYEFGGS